MHWKEIPNKEAKHILFFSQAAHILGHFYGRDVFLQTGVEAIHFFPGSDDPNRRCRFRQMPLKAEI